MVTEGQSASFSISTDGSSSKTYQWKHNGFIIPGATNATFTLDSVTFADRGRYEVSATDTNGTTLSVAYLNVAVPNASLVAWGRNDYGQTNVPNGLESIAAISTGQTHGLAVKGNGTVVGWGHNYDNKATPPAGLSNVVDVATGSSHSLALLFNGTVVIWGSKTEGQEVPAGVRDVVYVAAHGNISIALKSDGTVVAWGGSIAAPPVSNVPVNLTDVVAVSAGESYFMALKANGTVAEWGNLHSTSNPMPTDLNDVVSIGSGRLFSMALRSNGKVVQWRSIDEFVPLNLADVIDVAPSYGHSMTLNGDRTVSAWIDYESLYGETLVPDGLINVITIDGGQNYSVALVNAAAGLPEITSHPNSQTINSGNDVSFSVTASSSSALSYQWQREGINLLNGTTISGANSPTLNLSNIQSDDAGRYTVEVSNSTGHVMTSVRLFVDNTPVFTTRPLSRTAEAGDAITFTSVVSGSGIVYQWKHNGHIIPGAIGPTLSIPSVSLSDRGRYEIIATSSTDETAMSVFMFYPWSPNSWIAAWGLDDAQASIPSGLNKVVALATRGSGNHSLAVRSDGTVVAWGENRFGQTDVPSDLSDVVSVAVGGSHSLALKSDGTVVGWGLNDSNQISIPTGLTDVIAITAGFGPSSLALRADGSLVAWGTDVNAIRIPSGWRKRSLLCVGPKE